MKNFYLALSATLACTTGALLSMEQPLETKKLPKPFLVVIDPGHWSEIKGSKLINRGCEHYGLKEVVINFTIAKLLEEKLKEQNIHALLTKSTVEEFVTNKERANIANKNNAALFLRLHCDSNQSPDVNGFTLYYPDQQGQHERYKGPSLTVIKQSEQAALAIHEGMAEALKGILKDNGILGDSETFVGKSGQKALTGSIYSNVPVVLAEMIYLSNKKNAEFITSRDGSNKMVEALLAGILKHHQSLDTRKNEF